MFVLFSQLKSNSLIVLHDMIIPYLCSVIEFDLQNGQRKWQCDSLKDKFRV